MSIEYNELLLPGSKFLAIDGATKKMQLPFSLNRFSPLSILVALWEI